MKTSFVVYFALVALALFKTGSAIQCYYCGKGDTCEDIEHSSLHECTESDFPNLGRTAALHKAIEMDAKADFHCLKLDTYYIGEPVTIRGCSRQNCDSIGSSSPFVYIDKCSSCNSDKCNSSSTISFSMGLIAFGALLAFTKLLY